ncbi:hypothetical protein CP8484711_2982, partial [Chlamydia psittaci 84-8471/1]
MPGLSLFCTVLLCLALPGHSWPCLVLLGHDL